VDQTQVIPTYKGPLYIDVLY